MSGGLLFGRTCRLTLGTTQIAMIDPSAQALRIAFHVKKNLKPEPNTVEIKVWNLARGTRKSIESPKTVPVQLEVGSGQQYFTIFLGTLQSAHSVKEDADIVTSLSSGDSSTNFSSSRILAQVPAQAAPQQILSIAAKALGVGLGNSAQAPATATMGGPARTFHGSASKVLGQVCRANGLEWSVQDGALQIMAIGASVGALAVRLTPQTGMVGSPTVDTKGILSVKSLIQPDLWPGRALVVEGAFLQGSYRIEEVEFVGDTRSNDWYADIKARKWS